MSHVRREIIHCVVVAGLLGACQTAWTPPPVQTATLTPTNAPFEEILRVEGDWDVSRWSPDGARLALVQHTGVPLETPGAQPQVWAHVDGPVVLVEVVSGEQVELPQRGIGALWSSDGKSLLITSIGERANEHHLWLYWLADRRLESFPAPPGSATAWTGDRLIYETPDGLFSAPVESTNPITLGEPEALATYHLENTAQRWIFAAPDLETFMVYTRVPAAQPVIRWWLDSADGSSVEVSEDLYSLGTCCAWSPDGERLAFFADGPELTLNIIDRRGENARVILRASDIGLGRFISMDFSPSGDRIVFEWTDAAAGDPFANTQLYLVQVASGDWQKITEGPGPHRWVDWSPTGNLIAYYDQQGDVVVARIAAP